MLTEHLVTHHDSFVGRIPIPGELGNLEIGEFYPENEDNGDLNFSDDGSPSSGPTDPWSVETEDLNG